MLKSLSQFLELQYVIIPFELDAVKLQIKSAVFEWRLHKKSLEYTTSIAEIQAQCAEYSAIFNLIGKIALEKQIL